jgi:hypothetical protein
MSKQIFSMLILALFSTLTYANDKNVDCLILEDENSIICKYSHNRISVDKKIVVQWIEPNGKVSRQRDMTIPAKHGSIYDYRYIQGRTPGIWTFKVIDENKEYTTNFTIE